MDMQIMVHKTSSLENTLLKCWIIRCQIKGILLCTFMSYDQSARQDNRKIIVKMWRGSNIEEYKITVPFLSIYSNSVHSPILSTKYCLPRFKDEVGAYSTSLKYSTPLPPKKKSIGIWTKETVCFPYIPEFVLTASSKSSISECQCQSIE